MALWISDEQWQLSFQLVPRVAISLAIVDPKNRILLSKRSGEPGKGTWHLPGSFLFKDELFAECIKRILDEELCYTKKIAKPKLLDVFECLKGCMRGHVLDIIYQIELENDKGFTPGRATSEIRFFTTLPDNIGFNHREIANKIGYK